MTQAHISLGIGSLQQAYRDGSFTPLHMVEQVLAAIGDDPNKAWIHRIDAATLRAQALALMARGPEGLPLWGIPFAIKDNIDLAGVPTTAGCPDYAYTPEASATVVQRLLDAGAIAIGKTNLDQFATGLNGTRSPYGACRNAFNPDYVSGGSSAGSAVSVALGPCEFFTGHRHGRFGPRAGGLQPPGRPQAQPGPAVHARRGARLPLAGRGVDLRVDSGRRAAGLCRGARL